MGEFSSPNYLRVLPAAVSCAEVEVIDVAGRAFTGLPVIRQRSLDALSCNPEEMLISWKVHAQPFGILIHLLFRGLKILWNVVFNFFVIFLIFFR